MSPNDETEFVPFDPDAVQFGRAMGRMEAERIALEALARIVMAAGGEVRVPDRLVVSDVFMHTDYEKGETVYRASLSPDSNVKP